MFRLVERPAMMPGRSLIGSTVGPVVDTEVILRNGGRVYVTETEAGEIVKFFPREVESRARAMGWLEPEKVTELQDLILRLQGELAEAEDAQPKVIALDDARTLLAAKPKARTA